MPNDKWKVELSGKELNYIEMALVNRIHALRNDDSGNAPELCKFSIRVYNRLRKIRGFTGSKFLQVK